MFKIKRDPLNWILMEEVVIKNEKSKNFGRSIEKPVGYFSTVESLKLYAVEHILKINGLEELEKAKLELLKLLEMDKNK